MKKTFVNTEHEKEFMEIKSKWFYYGGKITQPMESAAYLVSGYEELHDKAMPHLMPYGFDLQTMFQRETLEGETALLATLLPLLLDEKIEEYPMLPKPLSLPDLYTKLSERNRRLALQALELKYADIQKLLYTLTDTNSYLKEKNE